MALLATDQIKSMLITINSIKTVPGISIEDSFELKRCLLDGGLYFCFYGGVLFQVWMSNLITNKTMVTAPLGAALLIRLFYRQTQFYRIFKNQSYCFWFILKVVFTVQAVQICLKLDETLDWEWSVVLWPMFIFIATSCVITVISVFVFIAWLCTKVNSHRSSLEMSVENKRQLMGSSAQFSISLWLLLLNSGMLTVLISVFMELSKSQQFQMTSQTPVLVCCSYFAIMPFFTLLYYKPLSKWLGKFKLNCHGGSPPIEPPQGNGVVNTMSNSMSEISGQQDSSQARQSLPMRLPKLKRDLKTKMTKELRDLQIKSEFNKDQPQSNSPKFIVTEYFPYQYSFFITLHKKMAVMRKQSYPKENDMRRRKYLDQTSKEGKDFEKGEDEIYISHQQKLGTKQPGDGKMSFSNQHGGMDHIDSELCQSMDRLFCSRSSQKINQQILDQQNQLTLKAQTSVTFEEMPQNDDKRQAFSDRIESSRHHQVQTQIKSKQDLLQFLSLSKPYTPHKQKLESESCELCCQAQQNAVIMPCGHGGLCFLCAFTLAKQSKCCHLCRKGVQSILQVESQNKAQLIRITAKLDFSLDGSATYTYVELGDNGLERECSVKLPKVSEEVMSIGEELSQQANLQLESEIVQEIPCEISEQVTIKENQADSDLKEPIKVIGNKVLSIRDEKTQSFRENVLRSNKGKLKRIIEQQLI